MESNREPQQYAGEKEDSQEEYSFLQETIKKEPLNKKMLIKHIGKIAVYGIIFGMAACTGFFALKPWAEELFHKTPEKITIPSDEEEDTENVEQTPQDMVVPEFTAESYKQMKDALYDIAREAERSVVEVRGTAEAQEWMAEGYDTVNSVSGIVVADTGVECLVLASDLFAGDGGGITITFNDNSTYEARLKRRDGNLGIAIFGVTKSDMKSSTLNQVKTAVLGNSNLIRRGDMVMVLGKPFGYSGGYSCGVISSVEKEISLADGDYALLLTDITGSDAGSGVLVNITGEIVGMILPKLTNSVDTGATNALAISDLKKTIELLSNGNAVPYVGVQGTGVTEQIEEEQGIPRGIYVESVESDSPAMKAGIQSGDVITNVGKGKVTTLNAYQNMILDYKAGDEVLLRVERKGNDGYVKIQFKVVIGSKE